MHYWRSPVLPERRFTPGCEVQSCGGVLATIPDLGEAHSKPHLQVQHQILQRIKESHVAREWRLQSFRFQTPRFLARRRGRVSTRMEYLLSFSPALCLGNHTINNTNGIFLYQNRA